MKAERQQASSDDGAGESFFISKHTYSSSIRSRAKASSQDEFSYLEGSDLYACFSSTAQFFSLEALKKTHYQYKVFLISKMVIVIAFMGYIPLEW